MQHQLFEIYCTSQHLNTVKSTLKKYLKLIKNIYKTIFYRCVITSKFLELKFLTQKE